MIVACCAVMSPNIPTSFSFPYALRMMRVCDFLMLCVKVCLVSYLLCKLGMIVACCAVMSQNIQLHFHFPMHCG